jgi:large subunit ribosomal protein L10
MPTQAKAAVIDEITERFQNSSAAVLTEYRGLTVAQLTQLRRSLGAGSSYAVVKNTLTKRAADSVGFSDLAPLLNGPTAIAFIEGDPVEAAKAIRDFAKPTRCSSSRAASSRAAWSMLARSPASPTSRAVRCS